MTFADVKPVPALGRTSVSPPSLSVSSIGPLPRAARGGGAIIVASLNRPTGSTGVHTHTRSLIDGLRAAGFACDLVTPFSGSGLWALLFAVRPLVLKRFHPTSGTLWYRYWHMAALRVNLRRAISAGGVRQVIAQCPPSARMAMGELDELKLRDRVNVTMVCHFNGSEADEYRDQGSLHGNAYERVKADEERTLSDVDRIIYVSSWARQLVERDRGIRTKASAVIWNGISDAARPTQIVQRADLALRDQDLVLINVGTLEPRKDQLGLVRLFATLIPEFPAAKLVLVGDGPHRPLIESLAKELGISSNVILLGHRSDVPALLAVADLYVHFASAENCPISLIEAARAGLPWAAKPAGGVRELLQPLGGVALEADDAQSREALRLLLNDSVKRKAIGEANRARFAASFTQAAMVHAYIEALDLNAAIDTEAR